VVRENRKEVFFNLVGGGKGEVEDVNNKRELRAQSGKSSSSSLG